MRQAHGAVLVRTNFVTQVPAKGPQHFVVEASTLGLRPGYWPETMATTLGNGAGLWMLKTLPGGGVRYRQARSDLVLDVLND